MTHDIKLTYTQMDDGVWLECSCSFEYHLGFGSTASFAAKIEQEHLNNLVNAR